MVNTEWVESGTQASVDRDGKPAWTNPTNAQSSDDSRSQCDIGASTYGDWLRCTNFGFEIPEGSTIDGIEVSIERRAENSTHVSDSSLYLRKTSGQVGDDYADTTTKYPIWDDSIATYGGAEDLWGTTWSVDDVNSVNFGVDLSCKNTYYLNRWAEVDCIKVKIYYTEGGGNGDGEDDSELDYIRTFLGKVHTTGTVKHYSECKNISLINDTSRMLVYPGRVTKVYSNWYKKRFFVMADESNEEDLTTALINVQIGIEKLNTGQEIADYTRPNVLVCMEKDSAKVRAYEHPITKRWTIPFYLDITFTTS